MIKSTLTTKAAAQRIVSILKDHYLSEESDILVGFDADGDIDFDYQSGGSNVELLCFATNNGFTFDLDADPAEAEYWSVETIDWLTEVVMDGLTDLEINDLVEFA